MAVGTTPITISKTKHDRPNFWQLGGHTLPFWPGAHHWWHLADAAQFGSTLWAPLGHPNTHCLGLTTHGGGNNQWRCCAPYQIRNTYLVKRVKFRGYGQGTDTLYHSHNNSSILTP